MYECPRDTGLMCVKKTCYQTPSFLETFSLSSSPWRLKMPETAPGVRMRTSSGFARAENAAAACLSLHQQQPDNVNPCNIHLPPRAPACFPASSLRPSVSVHQWEEYQMRAMQMV